MVKALFASFHALKILLVSTTAVKSVSVTVLLLLKIKGFLLAFFIALYAGKKYYAVIRSKGHLKMEKRWPLSAEPWIGPWCFLGDHLCSGSISFMLQSFLVYGPVWVWFRKGPELSWAEPAHLSIWAPGQGFAFHRTRVVLTLGSCAGCGLLLPCVFFLLSAQVPLQLLADQNCFLPPLLYSTLRALAEHKSMQIVSYRVNSMIGYSFSGHHWPPTIGFYDLHGVDGQLESSLAGFEASLWISGLDFLSELPCTSPGKLFQGWQLTGRRRGRFSSGSLLIFN